MPAVDQVVTSDYSKQIIWISLIKTSEMIPTTIILLENVYIQGAAS
jgi:hypothetical protein